MSHGGLPRRRWNRAASRTCGRRLRVIVISEPSYGSPIPAQQVVSNDLDIARSVLKLVPPARVRAELPGPARPGAERRHELEVALEVGAFRLDLLELLGDRIHEEAEAEDAEPMREPRL